MSELRAIMQRYGTDKATAHSYWKVYEDLFGPIRQNPLILLELGIQRGASLRAWRDYFPNATIFGVDNRVSTMISGEPRIMTFRGNSGRWLNLHRIARGRTFDIIIDDASHVIEHQIVALMTLWPNLKPGGYYIIEDIQHPAHYRLFAAWPHMKVLDRRKIKRRRDDTMVICQKV